MDRATTQKAIKLVQERMIELKQKIRDNERLLSSSDKKVSVRGVQINLIRLKDVLQTNETFYEWLLSDEDYGLH